MQQWGKYSYAAGCSRIGSNAGLHARQHACHAVLGFCQDKLILPLFAGVHISADA